MFRHAWHRYEVWLTVSLAAALGSLMLALAGLWPTALSIAAALFLSLGLGLWLKTIRVLSAGESRDWGFPDPRWNEEEEAPVAEAGRVSADRAIATCYEAAARISHVSDVSRRTGEEILKGLASVGRICERMHEAVAGSGGGDYNGATVSHYSQPVDSMLEDVTAAMREMAEVLREVDHNAKDLITSTEETTYSMSRLDSFLQDMASNGRDLESSTETANRVALEGTKVVGEMGKENEAIITSVKQAASAVEDLGRWSQEVGKIVEVIRDIADETNLLALNAAIIAAQSGEHGKAFGVVAEEIRGLAERTSSSTKEISDLVKAVQKNVANVVTNMKKSLQRVERGELLARNAGTVLEKVFESFESSRGLAKQIATSTFEHKIDSSHVVRSLHKVADIARRIEEHNFSKWAAAGETLATARVLKALSRNRQESAPVLAMREASAGQALAQVAGSLQDINNTGRAEGITSGLDKDIDRSQQSLKNISESLSSLLSLIDETASLVRSAARDIPADKGPETGRRCWEVTGCPEDIRQRCGAYTHADWRCFLTEGTACAQGESVDAHGRKECPECLAFPKSVASRTTLKAG
ncbi:methyl-accepting chemotaxis protein [Candidatus Eisenbacteria bacterium]|uniref:Methyl-accepting chemotaxis protein n=1 Tax=Eiseniibacteriota bacterium TaxID=2212470 RepID=A0ABV6YPS8_UNCEI